MTSPRRNILVAITVLGALAALGWMIIQFGGTLGSLMGGGGYAISMNTPRVDGLAEGNRVLYRGYSVGRVASIRLDDSQSGFEVGMLIRPETAVPGNVRGVVRTTNLISGAAIVELELVDDVASDSLLEGTSEIEGAYGDSELIPPEFAEMAEEMRGLIAELREAKVVDVINEQARKIGELADSLNEVVADDELRSDLKEAVANTRDLAVTARETVEEYRKFGQTLNELQADAAIVVADAKEISGDTKALVKEASGAVASARGTIEKSSEDVEALTEQFFARMAQMERTMTSIESVMAKVDNGDGTLGKLVNDPRAYEALAADLQELQLLLKTANRLAEQIEKEGFKFSVF